MDELTRLLVDARDGDRLALGAAIRASQADVWRLAAHLVGPARADDVTQEVFLRAVRSLPRFEARSSARTWLLAIARHTCLDELRRRRRRRIFTALREEHDDAVVVPSAEADLAVDALVDGLASDRRTAFVLTQLLGCSYAEAAQICAVPIGTVRSRVARAREDLLVALRAADAI